MLRHTHFLNESQYLERTSQHNELRNITTNGRFHAETLRAQRWNVTHTANAKGFRGILNV